MSRSPTRAGAPPGGTDNLHAPLAVIACIGLVFRLGGGSLILQGIGCGNDRGQLPAEARPWIHVAQRFIGVGLLASFALIVG